MIHVNRSGIPTPSIFSSKEMGIAIQEIEKFYKGKKESRSQKGFSKRFEPDFRTPILKSLRVLFNGKCAYCESEVNEYKASVYDHFRPKFGARGFEKEFADEHYWWLTYEWNNFYYTCEECNQFKASWFPVDGGRSKPGTPYHKIIKEEKNILLDPCNDNPNEHLLFKSNGEVDFLSTRGKATIELLNLNRKTLVKSRRLRLERVEKDWLEFIGLWNSKDKNNRRINAIGKEWALILIEKSDSTFVAACKNLIKDSIKLHPDIQEFLANGGFDLKQVDKKSETLLKGTVSRIESNPELHKLSSRVRAKIEKDSPAIVTKQIYLDSIELHNFKCFEDLILNLKPRETGKRLGQPWRLLLGENGVGKSSILKAIAIALMDSPYRSKMKEHLNPNRILRYGANMGFIKLKYNGGEEILVEFNKKGNSITSNVDRPLTNIIGYGSIRLLPRNGIQPEEEPYNGIKLVNLFDYSVSLNDANDWLLKQDKKEFDRAARTLRDVMLLNDSSKLIRKNNKILVQDGKSKPIDVVDLSDGYQTAYALTVDIMSTLSSEEITYDLAEGIILIDEIGTHLHPRWKMEIVGRLRTAFRNLQFIISTHEPLCLRGMGEDETTVLMRDELNEVIAISDLPDPSTLKIDQILTSKLFGLNSTLDPKTEKLFEEYYSILAKDLNSISSEEKNRMLELKEIIPRIKHLGDDLREEIAYFVIDELLAKEVKNNGLEIKERLKNEAVLRIKKAWESIKN